jgi:hypothetical protein
MSRSLEEQEMLLQSLAMKENAAKGFSRLEREDWLDFEIEDLKRNTCIMLQDIWNSRRQTHKSRSPY